MKTMLGAAAGLAALLIASDAAMTQDMPPPPPPGMRPMMPPPPPETRADMEKRVAEGFAALDLDKDGVVTRDEIDKSRDARRAAMRQRMETARRESQDRAFAALDKDSNGAISRAEFAAYPPPPPPPRGGGMRMDGPPPGDRGPMMMPPGAGGRGMIDGSWFDRFDANHDGKLTAAEMQSAALAMFDRADANHDGTISPDERRMPFPRRPQQPGDRLPHG